MGHEHMGYSAGEKRIVQAFYWELPVLGNTPKGWRLKHVETLGTSEHMLQSMLHWLVVRILMLTRYDLEPYGWWFGRCVKCVDKRSRWRLFHTSVS